MEAVKEITSILSAMGAKPIATTRNQVTTIKINAPMINKEIPIIKGYTIKAITPEKRYYYLINGWYKHWSFWLPTKEILNYWNNTEKITFKTIGSAKCNLTKLLKVMPEYENDQFILCEILSNGQIKEKEILNK